MTAGDGNDNSWDEIRSGVAPLKKKPKIQTHKKDHSKKQPPAKKTAEENLLQKWEAAAPETVKPAKGIGSKKEQRKITKEARNMPYLDLHGKTIDAAFTALQKFIKKQFIEGERTVMVITGKGKGEVSIASSLTSWLAHSELAKFVISYDNAPRELGGSGAWILKLRKPK